MHRPTCSRSRWEAAWLRLWGSLEHAYDLWNSSLFLVARREDVEKVYQHLEGTFHEIKGRPKALTPGDFKSNRSSTPI